MLKEKFIEIKSTTIDPHGEKDVIEVKTVGKYGVRDGKAFISYDDSGALGVDGVSTILKADKDNVVLKRTGSLRSRLEIERGERHQCHYSTAIGNFSVGIFGEMLENDLTEDGGKLSMSYTIDINSELMSRNQVEITIKEV